MDKIAARAEEAIEEKVFPGCVIGVLQNGEASVCPFGTMIYHSAEAVTADTVYDLASITKSIPLAALASILIAEGKFALTDLVREHIKDIEYDYDATIEDLLRYRVKGTQLSTLHYGTFEQIRTTAIERGFDGPPGAFQYTNLPAFILGVIIERTTGSSLPTLAHKHFFEPLGMDHTTFFPAASDCAPTEIVDLPRVADGKAGGETIRGIPHDESARVFARERRAVGHAGLFSTAGDLLKFAAHMLAEKDSSITRDAIAGLGWQIADTSFMGTRVGKRACGKTGFTGTSIVIDPDAERVLVILSNRTYPQRPMTQDAISAFRAEITDIVFA